MEWCFVLNNSVWDLLLNDKKLWIFDGDGVLYRQETGLPGTQELISFLSEEGITSMLVTNNSTKTRSGYAKKIRDLDLDISSEHIFTSAYASVEAIRDSSDSVYIIGEDGIKDACSLENIDVYSTKDILGGKSVDAVLIGLDRSLDYKKLSAACHAIEEGALFVGTNPDPVLPSDYGLAPGAGTNIAAVSAATGKKPDIIAGKPGELLFNQAMKKINALPPQTVMVGDRFETDILGASNLNINSVLVKTGIAQKYTKQQISEWKQKYNAPSVLVEDLVQLLKMFLDEKLD